MERMRGRGGVYGGDVFLILGRQIERPTKTYFTPEPKTDTTAQLEKKFLQPMRSEC